MEKNCFLFGHADTPQFILPILEQAIEQATQNGITSFYVGYHGNFDRLATTALRKIKLQYAN
ncbi:MAG: hypothetical protein IJP17_06450, partial [Clostridia bacterium]|nr:hypothetical protein [Clostridia bacterium]